VEIAFMAQWPMIGTQQLLVAAANRFPKK